MSVTMMRGAVRCTATARVTMPKKNFAKVQTVRAARPAALSSEFKGTGLKSLTASFAGTCPEFAAEWHVMFRYVCISYLVPKCVCVRRNGVEPAEEGARGNRSPDAGGGGQQQKGPGGHAVRYQEEAREGFWVPHSHVERGREEGVEGEACQGQEAVGAWRKARPQVTTDSFLASVASIDSCVNFNSMDTAYHISYEAMTQ